MTENITQKAEWLKKFLDNYVGWFIFGIFIGSVVGVLAWYIQSQRSERLEAMLVQEQEDNRDLQNRIITCKEEANKDYLQSMSEQMEMIKKMNENLKESNDAKLQDVNAKNQKSNENKKLIKQLDKIIKDDENS